MESLINKPFNHYCHSTVILRFACAGFPDFERLFILTQINLFDTGKCRYYIQMIMCDTQTLAASAEGYIIRCSDCGRMQLCFGIAAIALKQDQFNRLQLHTAEALLYGAAYSCEPDRRSISLPVNKTTILCLSWNELVALEDLVRQANALMEVYELLAKG